MKVVYFVEVLSSWCFWAEPAWRELQERYAGRGVTFEWKIALMNPADFPVSRSQCDWFYQRSGGTVMRSPFKLNSGWFEEGRQGNYSAPNLVAEAARSLGYVGDGVRLALTRSALSEGHKIGGLDVAVPIAAQVAQLPVAALREAAESDLVKSRVAATTAEFTAFQISQRPAFVLTDVIGDQAIFSGLVRIEPLIATIDAMIGDTAAYAAHAAHFGGPPQA